MIPPKQVSNIILIIFDALRYDFIDIDDINIKSNYKNNFPFIQNLILNEANHTVLMKLKSDIPTITV